MLDCYCAGEFSATRHIKKSRQYIVHYAIAAQQLKNDFSQS